jgi:hypothetical protein
VGGMDARMEGGVAFSQTKSSATYQI